MLKRNFLLGLIAVFVLWQVLDFVIHGFLLERAYAETSHLWRTDMNVTLIVLVGLAAAICFVFIYSELIGNKSVVSGVRYGLVFGIGAGVSFAFGTYAVIEIPASMALTWFLGVLAQGIGGGYLCGTIIRPDSPGE